MIGDTVIVDGVELEVVWAGGEGLVPDRESKSTGFWVAPKRLYNKSGLYTDDQNFWKKSRKIDKPKKRVHTRIPLEKIDAAGRSNVVRESESGEGL